MPQFGEVRVDFVTFTTGVSPSEANVTASISGLIKNPTFSGDVVVKNNLDVEGNITITGTVTGNTGNFTTVTTTTANVTSGIFASGTAAAPSVSVGTTDNGIYSPGTDQVAISTNGTGRLHIDNTGRVGIGTSSPAQLLELSSAAPRLRITDSDTLAASGSNSYLEFYGSDARAGIIYTDATGINIWADSTGGGNLAFRTGISEKMRINSSGNVGIGTSSPAGKLHVSNVGTARFFIEGNDGRSEIRASNGNLTFFANEDANPAGLNTIVFYRNGTNESMRINSAGNVGIGTSAPTTKLEISEPVGSSTPAQMKFINQGDRGVLVGFDDHNASPNFSVFNGDQTIEFVSIDSSGNVGIGTSSPDRQLHVADASSTGFVGARIENNNSLTGTAGIEFSTDSTYAKAAIGHLRNSLNGRGDIVFYNDENNDAANWQASDEKMRLTYTGRLGIGTSISPVRDKTHIYGNGQTTANIADSGTRNCFLRLSQAGSSAGTGGGILFASQQGDNANSVGFAAIKGLLTDGTNNTAGHLAFSVRNATTATSLQEAMRITPIGNLGIGTTSPNYKLHVNVPISGGSERTAELAHGADVNFKLVAANGSNTNTTGEEVSRFGIFYEGTGWDTYTKYIRGGGAQLGSLAFSTADTEKVLIDSIGSLYVGYSTGGSIANAIGCVKARSYNTKQGVAGALRANVFNIDWSPPNANLWIDTTNIGTFVSTSDYRVKDNVVSITSDCISRIKQLRPVQFEYTDYGVFSADGVVREGFIAHEVQEVIPSGADGVKDAENQLQSLKTDAILSVTVKALQEAVAKIETLETKVAALEAAG